jgi:hypothetical protein
LAFPNPDNLPPSFSQRAIDKLISRDVALELRQPEFLSCFGAVAELTAQMSMPEAAIDKHSYSRSWKSKVGLAEYRFVPSPAGYCCFAE